MHPYLQGQALQPHRRLRPLRRPRRVRGVGGALLRVRGVRRRQHHGGGDPGPGEGHPRGARRRHGGHHGGVLRPRRHALPHAALPRDRPRRALLRRVLRRRHGVGKVRGGVRRAQGDDHRAARQRRRAGEVPDAHREGAHGAAVPRPGAPEAGDAGERHGGHARRDGGHRAVHRPRRPRQPPLHLHALHLHARRRRAARPPLLRHRRDGARRPEQARRLPRRDRGVVGRDGGVLGAGRRRRRVGSVRGGRAGVARGDAVPAAEGADGEDAGEVGGAAGAMAAVGVHLHQHLPPRLHRRQVVHAVRGLDGGAARLLLLLRSARLLRHRQGARRRGRRRQGGGRRQQASGRRRRRQLKKKS